MTRKATTTEEPLLVLVVDDYSDAREMSAEFLKFSGFRVEEAADGIEAIEKATASLPDVILMDLSLPRLDGWEATRRLKKDVRTQHIPIIALTGHALAGHAEGAQDAGCDAFLTKPCLPDAMLAEVRRVLEAAKKPADTAKPAAAAKPAKAAKAPKPATKSETASTKPRRTANRRSKR